MAYDDGPISFDGVYTSVYNHYRALKGKDVTFFFSGKYLGGNNSFDVGQPLSTFCTWDEILEMAEYLDAKIGYHGWAHLRCPTLTEKEIVHELTPIDLAEGCSLAWPYGDYDERCIKIARDLGYSEAWSVFPKGGDARFDSKFTKNRYFLNWDHYDAEGTNWGKR